MIIQNTLTVLFSMARSDIQQWQYAQLASELSLTDARGTISPSLHECATPLSVTR